MCFLWDETHRQQNDLIGGVRRAGARWWTVMALLAVPFQVNFAPYDGGAWFQKAKGGVSSYFTRWGGLDCPLFRSILPQRAFDRGEPRSSVTRDAWVAARFAEFEPSGAGLGVHGKRLNWSRFGSWLDCQAFWDTVWHLRVAAWTLLGIVLGYVNGTQQSRNLKLKKAGESVSASSGSRMPDSTKTAKAKATTAMLRLAAKNTLHCALMILMIPGLQIMSRMIAAVGRPYRKAQGQQMKDNVDPVSNLRYYAGQALGIGLLVVVESLKALFTLTEQSQVGLKVVESDMPAAVKDVEHCCIMVQGDLYNDWVNLGFNLAGTRCESLVQYSLGPIGIVGRVRNAKTT
jgi:hypothetical protein